VKREQQERVHAGSGRKKTKKKNTHTREEVKKKKSSSLPPGYICYVRGSRITCVSKSEEGKRAREEPRQQLHEVERTLYKAKQSKAKQSSTYL